LSTYGMQDIPLYLSKYHHFHFTDKWLRLSSSERRNSMPMFTRQEVSTLGIESKDLNDERPYCSNHTPWSAHSKLERLRANPLFSPPSSHILFPSSFLPKPVCGY
jgi:hypothetical protein